MVPTWFSSFLENDSVLRTSRETRCLRQSGTFWTCPLPQGAVEALDEVCFAAALASSLIAFSREHLGVRLSEVGVEHSALPIDTQQRAPETFSARLASTADEYTDNLRGCGVQRQPDPLFALFRSYKRLALIALDA